MRTIANWNHLSDKLNLSPEQHERMGVQLCERMYNVFNAEILKTPCVVKNTFANAEELDAYEQVQNLIPLHAVLLYRVVQNLLIIISGVAKGDI